MAALRPALTKAVIPGTLAIGCGDVLCQKLEGKAEVLPERTARMMVTGAVCVTPLSYIINRGASQLVPGRSMEALIKKSLANAAATVLFIVGSFSGNNLLQGRSTRVLQVQLQERLLPTYALGLGYWSGAHLLLAKFVPQGLVGGFLAQTVWSVYMSRQLNKKTPALMEAVAAEQQQQQLLAHEEEGEGEEQQQQQQQQEAPAGRGRVSAAAAAVTEGPFLRRFHRYIHH